MVALEAHYGLRTKPAKKDTTTSFGLTTKQLQNIYALCNFIKQYRVSYDSAKSTSICVHRKERNGMSDVEFKKHLSGLHYWDSTESKTGNISV